MTPQNALGYTLVAASSPRLRYLVGTSALALAAVALAQDASVTVIHVGKTGLLFDPSNIKASNGSIVSFVFDGAPGNHTVAQSSFAKPCEPLPNGFDSGFIFVPQGTTDNFPTFNLTITNDQAPIWFYCAQEGAIPPTSAHCPAGMVGSINTMDTGNTFSSYHAIAEAAASVVAPVPALSGVNAFATAAPGPLSGSISGAAVPTGTLPALSDPVDSGDDSPYSGASASGVATRTTIFTTLTITGPATNTQLSRPSTVPDINRCPTSITEIRGLLAFFAVALAVGLAVNFAGMIWLCRIWHERRRVARNTPEITRKVSPFV